MGSGQSLGCTEDAKWRRDRALSPMRVTSTSLARRGGALDEPVLLRVRADTRFLRNCPCPVLTPVLMPPIVHAARPI